MIARKFILANKVVGLPKLSDFKLVEENLPELNDGELLAKAEWWTVDPYIRVHCINFMSIGDIIEGAQIARVIKSQCDEFPVGTQIIGYFGWRDMTVYKPDSNIPRSWKSISKIPDMMGLPDSYALGCLGMPGNTAYFGMSVICVPKPGETLVVSAAAGAVGSLVGQIGKLKGCKVIGFAGDDAKVNWLEELGFDLAFNYKKINIDKTLRENVPEGVDCYFDNVGGEFAYDIMQHMNNFGRIAQCGTISEYNKLADNSKPLVYFDFPKFRLKSLRMEGFTSARWTNTWFEGINQMRKWILEGKIKVHETVTEGFENLPRAFIDLLEGRNIGKQIIKA